VTYLAGELAPATQTVFLDDISSIPAGELYRIAAAVPTLEPLVLYELPVLEAESSPDWSSFEASIVALLGVSASIASDIREALLVAQKTANAVADVALAARLRCVWKNRQVHAVCSADVEQGYALIFHPDTPAPGVESQSVAAGTVSSSESQEDADAKAGRQAAQGLTCLYCNDEQIATCAEEEGGAFAGSPTIEWVTDFDYPRETSVIPLLNLDGAVFRPAYSLPDTRTLKLTSTVAACFLKARTTEEANALALALAVAGLDCFVPSRRRLFSCTDADAWGNETANGSLGGLLTEEEILNEMVTGDIAGSRVNNVGVVDNTSIDLRVGVQTSTPPGMFFGSTSAEAEGLSEAFAAATLRCEWGNHALIYACDDLDSNPSVDVEVANHTVAAYPTPLTRANKAGKIILSSALGRNLSMLASPRRSHVYSADVAARQFFSVNGQDAVDRVAAAFVLGQLECTYCNPRIPPVCATFVTAQADDNDQAPPYTAENVILPLVVNDSRLAPAQSADATSGVPGIHYINDATSTTPLTDPLVAPANYLTDAIADAAAITCGAIEEVLTIADVIGVIPTRDLVTQNQRCRYGNRRMNFSCAAGAADDIDFTTPLTTLEEAYLSAASTPSAGNFFTIAENTYEVYAASERAEDKVAAQVAADDQAEAVGLSQLDCFYESPLLHLYCGATVPPVYNTIAAELYVSSGDAVILPTVYPGIKNGQTVGGASIGSYVLETNRPVVAQHGYAKSYTSPQGALDEAFYASLAQLDCFFESAKIIMTCGAPTVLEVETPPVTEAGTITAGRAIRRPIPVNATYWSDYEGAEYDFAAESHGSVENPVVVERRLFRSYESQHDANTVAYLSALAQLDCFFDSTRQLATCGSPGGGQIVEVRDAEGNVVVWSGGGTWSKYSTASILINAGAIRSYVSQEQADRSAYSLGQGSLVCFYTNTWWEYTGCPADHILVAPGYVGEAEFTSFVSQEAADAPARKLAIASVVCQPIDDEVVEYWRYNTKQEDCQCGEGGDAKPAIKCGVVASGTIRAEGASDESAQAAANAAAHQLAIALKQCPPYTNSRQEYDICSPGLGDQGGLLRAGIVPAGVITSSESQADADGAAMALAKSLVQCYPWAAPSGEGVQALVTRGSSEGKASWMETAPCEGDEESGSSYNNSY
jgi:hypothetical protein